MNTTFTFNNGNTYTRKANGYCFAEIDGKKTRCSTASFEMALRQYEMEKAIEEVQESADTEAAEEYDQWAAEADAEYQARKDLQEAKDRETEANYEKSQKSKKTRKPRRSKDIAYEGNGLTLTAKQVDFLRHLPDTHFWEQGLDSVIFVDCLCDDIQGQFKGKPMTVGAMVSTICEKGLGNRSRDDSRAGKPTVFSLTELGKVIAAELGVH